MKGVIYGLLADAVSDAIGDEGWEAVLSRAGVSGIYTSLGNYPDEELLRLIDATAEEMGNTSPEVLRWFGRAAMPLLIADYPHFFSDHAGARGVLLALNDIIHPEVRKLYAGASCPRFHFRTERDRLIVGYRSQRRLCRLAHGFIEGVAAHFHEGIAIDHLSCVHEGNPTCQLEIRWAS